MINEVKKEIQWHILIVSPMFYFLNEYIYRRGSPISMSFLKMLFKIQGKFVLSFQTDFFFFASKQTSGKAKN